MIVDDTELACKDQGHSDDGDDGDGRVETRVIRVTVTQTHQMFQPGPDPNVGQRACVRARAPSLTQCAQLLRVLSFTVVLEK